MRNAEPDAVAKQSKNVTVTFGPLWRLESRRRYDDGDGDGDADADDDDDGDHDADDDVYDGYDGCSMHENTHLFLMCFWHVACRG